MRKTRTTTTSSISFVPELFDRVVAHAQEDDRSQSWVVNEALRHDYGLARKASKAAAAPKARALKSKEPAR
ncbi:MAG TPA: hypothetical protein VKF17_00845 [Isosphaeraceae bacterium]|nr:hypothetical protein [Isosphaeraceae bacterium]